MAVLRALDVDEADSASAKSLWEEAQAQFSARLASTEGNGPGDTDAASRPAWWRRPLTGKSGLIAVGVAGLAVAGVIVGFITWPSQIADDTSPTATKCSNPAEDQFYYSHLYPDWPLNRSRPTNAEIEMHYSPRCRSVWAVLHDANPGTKASLIRVDDGRTLNCEADGSGACSTNQLNDADMTSFAHAISADAQGETPPA